MVGCLEILKVLATLAAGSNAALPGWVAVIVQVKVSAPFSGYVGCTENLPAPKSNNWQSLVESIT